MELSNSSSRVYAASIIANILLGRGSLSSNYESILPKKIPFTESPSSKSSPKKQPNKNIRSKGLASKDLGFIKEICFGVCRQFPKLDFIANELMDKKLKRKDSDIYALILMGIYQILELRVSDHAAVSETAEAAKKLKKKWAVGLINAILRNVIRQKDELLRRIDTDDCARNNMPKWLLEEIKKAWPYHYEAIIEESSKRPPLSLRINTDKISRESYSETLTKGNIEHKLLENTDSVVVLDKPVSIEKIHGFKEGEVSIQDGAAQFAAKLLDVDEGMRVLDACAAPGGKTAHILELFKGVELFALDVEANRLKKVNENLSRIGLKAKTICGDATSPDKWWDGELFDRILLDAPCSGTGVLRRNPDIKVMRTSEEVSNISLLQKKLLSSLWPLLKPGGIMLYATCSILPVENDKLIENWLKQQKDAKILDIHLGCGHAQVCGVQILTGENGMDGFFYSKIKKV